MRTTLSLALFALAACAHSARPSPPLVEHVAEPPTTQPASSVAPSCIASKRSHAERIAEHGSALDQYHRQDGVWLPHAPVLVNEEFDFMLAVSMEDGIGAGLAAAKRQQNNKKRAQELAELRFDEAATMRLTELRCCGREVYFVLWGTDGAIRMVVDGGEGQVVEGQAAVGRDQIVHRAGDLLRGLGCP